MDRETRLRNQGKTRGGNGKVQSSVPATSTSPPATAFEEVHACGHSHVDEGFAVAISKGFLDRSCFLHPLVPRPRPGTPALSSQRVPQPTAKGTRRNSCLDKSALCPRRRCNPPTRTIPSTSLPSWHLRGGVPQQLAQQESPSSRAASFRVACAVQPRQATYLPRVAFRRRYQFLPPGFASTRRASLSRKNASFDSSIPLPRTARRPERLKLIFVRRLLL